MNSQNVAKYGREADYKVHPRLALMGSIFGGGIWAAIFTAIVGLFL
ncbi:hypothetical protein OPW57_16035 [Vibrio europaeus]|nr:hypothetical protein [Vibrio europaeus]MDC5720984.1 hypothetical protein [Vibrio europaeus]